jgi:glycosyltransferase involved in cell wall biosynthesis
LDRLRVALVVPALNESATITAVVTGALVYGHCIVVDDGSSDNTAELASQAGATVVSHTRNLGYDAALNSGFRAAAELDCDAVVTLDADGQHNPQLVQRFVDGLNGGADVVLGIRDQRPRIAEHLFALYTQWRFGIADPLCGMKAYRVEVYRALGHFDRHSAIGTELMLFAARRGYKLAAVPFAVGQRLDAPRFGRKFSANIRIFRALLLALQPGKAVSATPPPC